MNWQALGAVGELVAAIGVIVSLLYLADQVRQNSRQLRNAAAASVTSKMSLCVSAPRRSFGYDSSSFRV